MRQEKEAKTREQEPKEPLVIEINPSVLPEIDKYAKKVNHDYQIFQKDVERRYGSFLSRNDLQTIIASDHSNRLNSSMHTAAAVYAEVSGGLRNGRKIVINPLEQTSDVRSKGFTVIAYTTTYDIGLAGVDEFLSLLFPTPENDHTWESPNGLVRRSIQEALDDYREVHLKLPTPKP